MVRSGKEVERGMDCRMEGMIGLEAVQRRTPGKRERGSRFERGSVIKRRSAWMARRAPRPTSLESAGRRSEPSN